MSDLKANSFKSLLWNAGGIYFAQATAFITAAIMGRLLRPEDFGLVGMVLAVNAFLVLFANVGLSTTVVQHRDLSSADISALRGLSLVFGLGSSALLLVGAPLVASFFKDDRLYAVSIWIAPTLLFTALSQVPLGVLQRDLKFKYVAGATIFASSVSSIVAIGLAVNGAGYWALVVQVVLRSVVQYIMAALFCPESFRFTWDGSLYRRVFGFTGNLTLFQLVNYFHRNLDALLIGRFVGVVSLGFYTRSSVLLMTFNQAMSGVINPVLHSALARKSGDVDAMRRGYGCIVESMLWVSCPLMAALAAFNHEVIRIVWGSGWDAAAEPFFWLALAGMHQSLFGTIGSVFAARADTRGLLACGIVTTVLFGSAIALGLTDGIVGVARSYSIASHIVFLPLMSFVWKRLLNGTGMELMSRVASPMLFGWLLIIGLFVSDRASLFSPSITTVAVIGVWTLLAAKFALPRCRQLFLEIRGRRPLATL